MDSSYLEKLTIVQLRKEVTKLGLTPKSTKKECFEQISEFYAEHESDDPSNKQEASENVDFVSEDSESVAKRRITKSDPHPDPESQEPWKLAFVRLAERMTQQQATLDRIVNMQLEVNHTRQASQVVLDGPLAAAPSAVSQVSSRVSDGQSQSVFTSVSTAQAVSLLASQISVFSGTEEEDVELWLRRVDRVAHVHGVNDSVKHLSATSKLQKYARDWFESDTTPVAESWLLFKEAIRKRFKRRVPFHVAIQKIEARHWNFNKETFQEYAMQKLKLIHPLSLPTRDVIQLLIGGIQSLSIRSAAATLHMVDVDTFLDRMYEITSICASVPKKSSPTASTKFKHKESPLSLTVKPSSPKFSKDISCAYCKAKGHIKADCFKLKRKEQASSASATTLTSSSVAAAEEVVQGKQSTSTKEDSDLVGCVNEDSPRQLKISDPIVEINSINGITCSLFALIDTGSPVSFIQQSIFKIFFGQSSSPNNLDTNSFQALNNTHIEVVGTQEVEVKLVALPNIINKVNLRIINNQKWSTHIVLGRDFLSLNNLTLLFNPSFLEAKDRLKLFNEVASADIYEKEESDNLYPVFQSDFGAQVDSKVRNLIEEVQNTPVEKVNDNYSVVVPIKDNSTFAYAPRRLAWVERLQIRDIIDDLLSREIIKESNSPYCSRVVPVRKKNGQLRLCVDLRPLNERVHKQKYPFPVIEDCLSRLGDKKVFTLLDLKEGFHLIKIHPDFTKYFAFATPDGQYEYLRLPFGYSEAPAEFQKRLIQILYPLIRSDKLLVYIDDILIPTGTIKENLDILRQTMLVLKRYDFELNVHKCQFLKSKIEYLGYMISEQGITLSERHVDAVKQFPIPLNIQQLQRFLGLVSFFRRFIPNFAIKAKPLYNLLKKSVVFQFDDKCFQSFEILKASLITYPVLRLYNQKLEIELHTDASSIAIAAILLQKQSSGAWAPVAYYSQSTNNAESRYHSFELEMLAIVKAIERFHIYLYGIEFTIITDCYALVFAINKANINPRIARWILKLQNYSFKIVHRKGEKMAHVDALSRIVAPIDLIPLEQELQFRQLADPQIDAIANGLEKSSHDKFILIDGLVYRKGDDKPRFYVPDAMVMHILRIYHDNSAHCGVEKTIRGITDSYWFPSYRKKIQSYVDNCITCLTANIATNVKEGEMSVYRSPEIPLHTLHLDHFGPLSESHDGFKHVLVVIDACTRFTWLFPVKSTNSKETISHLSIIFNSFGNPSEVISDRGTAFTSSEFNGFVNKRNIKHRLVAVAAPWSNGMVERVNRFLKSSLKKVVEDQEIWSDKIFEIQYVINNTYHSSIKNSPSKVLLGYEKRNHLDSQLSNFLNELSKSTLNPLEMDINRDENREIAIQATSRLQDYNKLYYDKHHKKPSKYKVGDYVLIRNMAVKPGEEKKFKSSYKGPYLIAKELNNNRYVIKDIPGFNITSRPYNSILSPDKLKPWIKPVVS